jgi:Asp-tRNA(Asn)/Glu-tRNA(Gln) amidotransferase A subunit family amidase
MKTYDAVLTPVCSTMSYDRYAIEDAFEKVFKESVFTAVPNLIGAPALVSGGVQLIGKNFAECTLLSIAGAVEKEGK